MSEKEENVTQRSNERQSDTNPNGEDFRTLLKTNSRGSSERTAETVRAIDSETTSQFSSKLNEIKLDLNSQTREQVISELVLPQYQRHLR